MRGRKGKVEPKETASRRERERESLGNFAITQFRYIYIYIS